MSHHSDISMLNFDSILFEFARKIQELERRIQDAKNPAIEKLLKHSLQHVKEEQKRFIQRTHPQEHLFPQRRWRRR